MKIYNWNYFVISIILAGGAVFRLFEFSGILDLVLIPVLIYQAIRAFRISRTKKETMQNSN